MSNHISQEDEKKLRPRGAVSRRDILLTGASALATAGVLSAELTMPAQAQQQAPAAPGGRRPNILVIMGDDIGMWNLSAYSPRNDGLSPRPTSTASPVEGRDLHRPIRPAILHGGTRRVHHHRAELLPHGPCSWSDIPAPV